jgi:FixJ family two-component response regulator
MDLRDPRGLASLLNKRIGRSVVLKAPLIAIIDDDKSMRDTTRDLLESAGFSAATFASAARLLKSQRLHRVSCLIADMRMPKMTGLELHQHLVASNRAIPTILMTAYPEERMRAQAMKANVVCYLAKPFEAEELLNCVRRAIRGEIDDPKA